MNSFHEITHRVGFNNKLLLNRQGSITNFLNEFQGMSFKSIRVSRYPFKGPQTRLESTVEEDNKILISATLSK